TSVYVASAPELETVTGKYFVDCRSVRSSAQSYRSDAARMLWAVSEQLTEGRGYGAICFPEEPVAQ
ncbi:MAG: hypothetical protein ACXWCX_24295, partial [Burkholderiales bacterium]